MDNVIKQKSDSSLIFKLISVLKVSQYKKNSQKNSFRRTWLKKTSKINHVLSEAENTLMKRASKTEFPKFASPVIFDNEAQYVAQ